MNLEQSYGQDDRAVETRAQAAIVDNPFRDVSLPAVTMDMDFSEVKLAIAERIKNIAARATGRSADSFTVLDGRPEELGKKSSPETASHRENEFFLVDFDSNSITESDGAPVVLHVELVVNDGRTVPIIRPYSNSTGLPNPNVTKICAAVYNELGLSIESQRALISNNQTTSIKVPSSLTPFSWTSNDIALGVIAHAAITPFIFCALQLAHSSEASQLGWVAACAATLAAAGISIYYFWDKISYLKRRSHVASLVEHLDLTDDRRALKEAVQGTIDHDTFKLLDRYVGDRKSASDCVALAHAIAKIGIVEISYPRRLEYWVYDTEAQKYQLYWDVIDQSTVFGWLSKIGGSNPDAQVQRAVHQARAKLEEFLSNR